MMLVDVVGVLTFGVTVEDPDPDNANRYQIHEGVIVAGFLAFVVLVGVLVVVALWRRIGRDLEAWQEMRTATRRER
jgi:hypothetical protein